MSSIEELHGKYFGLKIGFALFVLTTVRVGCLVEQLACSTAGGSGIHEGVHRKFPLAVLQNKQN